MKKPSLWLMTVKGQRHGLDEELSSLRLQVNLPEEPQASFLLPLIAPPSSLLDEAVPMVRKNSVLT